MALRTTEGYGGHADPEFDVLPGFPVVGFPGFGEEQQPFDCGFYAAGGFGGYDSFRIVFERRTFPRRLRSCSGCLGMAFPDALSVDGNPVGFYADHWNGVAHGVVFLSCGNYK